MPGICASLGGLVYGAASYGLSDAEEIGKQLLEEWLSSITSDVSIWLEITFILVS